MRSGGVGAGASAQGINAYGASNNGMNSGMQGAGLGADQLTNSISNWETIVVDAPEFTYKGHDPKEPALSVKSYMFNNGNDYSYAILSGSGDATARLWTLEGKYDEETTEWSITNARVRGVFKDEHKQGVTKAAFSPDYSYILTSSYDQSGRLWTISKHENIRVYLGAQDRLWSITPSPNGQYVAGACNDGRVYFWMALNVKKLATIPNREDLQALAPNGEDEGHEGPIFDAAFDPTSVFVATAGADGTVRLWNTEMTKKSGNTEFVKQVAVLKGHSDKVYSVCFSQDGSRLLTASRDKTARLWDPSTGEELCRFIGHEGAVRQAVFAGQYVCTASDDGTARIWAINAPSNNQQRQGMGMSSSMSGDLSMPQPSPMVGSTSDRQQQNAGGKPTRREGRPKGVELARFEANAPIFSIDVTEDMVYVVGGCQDGVVRIWRVPGNARYFGDSSSSQYGGRQGGYGLGGDPLSNQPNLESVPLSSPK